MLVQGGAWKAESAAWTAVFVGICMGLPMSACLGAGLGRQILLLFA